MIAYGPRYVAVTAAATFASPSPSVAPLPAPRLMNFALNWSNLSTESISLLARLAEGSRNSKGMSLVLALWLRCAESRGNGSTMTYGQRAFLEPRKNP